MGVIKDIKDEGGHGWKEPTVRESLIAIYKASCMFPYALTTLSFLDLFSEHPCSEAKLIFK